MFVASRISTFDIHAIKAPEEGGQRKGNEKGTQQVRIRREAPSTSSRSSSNSIPPIPAKSEFKNSKSYSDTFVSHWFRVSPRQLVRQILGDGGSIAKAYPCSAFRHHTPVVLGGCVVANANTTISTSVVPDRARSWRAMRGSSGVGICNIKKLPNEPICHFQICPQTKRFP